jgi:hypothetical protein
MVVFIFPLDFKALDKPILSLSEIKGNYLTVDYYEYCPDSGFI